MYDGVSLFQTLTDLLSFLAFKVRIFIIMGKIAQLDKFDLEILKMVQKDNLTPHRVVADAINLSVPSVARRLQRLRATGVIAADQSVLSPPAVGAFVTIVVHVWAESEAIELLDRMKQRFKACPQVQQCYYVTGDVDFILIMATRDMEEYTAITRSLFFAAGNVRHFRTFVVMERVKVSLNVSLADGGAGAQEPVNNDC